MSKVRDVMSQNVQTIKGSSSLKEARSQMQENDIKHLLVAEADRKLRGLVSDRDIQKFVSPFIGSTREQQHDKATLSIKLENIMVKKVVSCHLDDPAKKCIELMLQRKVHAIPVLDEEDVIQGIVTTSDLLRAYVKIL